MQVDKLSNALSTQPQQNLHEGTLHNWNEYI